MTSTLLLALTGFASALAGGLLQALASRQTERHRFFRENKREVYGHFLTALSHLSIYSEDSAEGQAARALIAESRCKIALYGSQVSFVPSARSLNSRILTAEMARPP